MYCIHAPSDVASLACELIENGLIGVGDIVVLGGEGLDMGLFLFLIHSQWEVHRHK